jgi:hypothetical protein
MDARHIEHDLRKPPISEALVEFVPAKELRLGGAADKRQDCNQFLHKNPIDVF